MISMVDCDFKIRSLLSKSYGKKAVRCSTYFRTNPEHQYCVVSCAREVLGRNDLLPGYPYLHDLLADFP